MFYGDRELGHLWKERWTFRIASQLQPCARISLKLYKIGATTNRLEVHEVNKNVYTVSFDKPAGLAGIRFNHVSLPQVIPGLGLAVRVWQQEPFVTQIRGVDSSHT